MTSFIVYLLYFFGGIGISMAVFNFGYSQGEKIGYLRGRSISFREVKSDR